MLGWINADERNRRTAHDIYGAAVAQARQPAFYAEAGIPDTPEGRFEAIVLHLFLVLERLRAEGGSTEATSRAIIERFVTDMDDQMREMGVGDLTVPKKVKKAAAAFYARSGAYRAGLEQTGDEKLTAVVRDILPATHASMASSVAGYIRRAHVMLTSEPVAAILAGRPGFPDAGPFTTEGMP